MNDVNDKYLVDKKFLAAFRSEIRWMAGARGESCPVKFVDGDLRDLPPTLRGKFGWYYLSSLGRPRHDGYVRSTRRVVVGRRWLKKSYMPSTLKKIQEAVDRRGGVNF